ncbi:MAG: hypothetical protein FWF78_06980 [Defluviitaleaceae bacterium]|nr:hypothetical protein [Defluviitaleaceae bacterium]
MKIEQHMYTRCKRGLFNTTAGYDTVAKSPGLTDDFIKKILHPLCVFGGGDRAVTLVNLPDGRVFLGQAVATTDFTGQRSTFFMHNYILPADMAGNIEGLLGARFETSYSEGGELKSLKSLPREPQKSEVFDDATDYEYLAGCIISAVVNSKKLYVHSTFSHDAITKIYRFLPPSIRHVLGFCTYSKEAERRSGVHLIFTENKSLINQTTNSNAKPEEGDVFSRIYKLSYTSFFAEVNFWHIRMPHLRDFFHVTEVGWLENNLKKLTPKQFATIPTDFIKRGKNSKTPKMYILVSIMKKISEARLNNREVDLRYFLGSYFLSDEDYRTIIEFFGCTCRSVGL